jgi:hypothetical protein
VLQAATRGLSMARRPIETKETFMMASPLDEEEMGRKCCGLL